MGVVCLRQTLLLRKKREGGAKVRKEKGSVINVIGNHPVLTDTPPREGMMLRDYAGIMGFTIQRDLFLNKPATRVRNRN